MANFGYGSNIELLFDYAIVTQAVFSQDFNFSNIKSLCIWRVTLEISMLNLFKMKIVQVEWN